MNARDEVAASMALRCGQVEVVSLLLDASASEEARTQQLQSMVSSRGGSVCACVCACVGVLYLLHTRGTDTLLSTIPPSSLQARRWATGFSSNHAPPRIRTLSLQALEEERQRFRVRMGWLLWGARTWV